MMQSQQPGGVEADQARSLWLDRRADRLEPHEQPLPRVADPHRIGGHEHEPRTAGQGLPHAHPWMHPERLCGQRDLSHLLHRPRLGSERCRRLQELRAVTGGDRQLKPRKQDTDHVSHHERMFAYRADGTNAL